MDYIKLIFFITWHKNISGKFMKNCGALVTRNDGKYENISHLVWYFD